MHILPWLRVATTALALASLAAIPAAYADLQQALDKYVTNEGLPGGVMLLSGPGQRQVVVNGVANRKTNEPVRADTRFYVASVGKMAVAVAILQMVDEGRLSLEAPVAPLVSHLPKIAGLANLGSAKLKQLLDHSSGIPDYLTDTFTEASRADAKRRWTGAEALAYAVGEAATNKPGKRYEYSNTNYVLLGEILAAVDGVPLAQVLQRRIFDRAGMTRTTVGVDDPGAAGLAHGYADEDDDGRLKDVSLLSWNFPFGDGALTTTAEDMERFLFALFRDGVLLKPATATLMATASARSDEYGLGTELGEDKAGAWVGHTGSFDGFEAEIRYHPDNKVVTIYMVNGSSSSDVSPLDKAAKMVGVVRDESATPASGSSGRRKGAP
jgi:D-alanyl-D-alanine carboxypeptidase